MLKPAPNYTQLVRGEWQEFQTQAQAALSSAGYWPTSKSAPSQSRLNNLYYLEVVPQSKDALLVNYRPTSLQLVKNDRTKDTQADDGLMPLADWINSATKLSTSFVVSKSADDTFSHSKKQFDLTKSANSFDPNKNIKDVTGSNEYIIAEPFMTRHENNLVIHFVTATPTSAKTNPVVCHHYAGYDDSGNVVTSLTGTEVMTTGVNSNEELVSLKADNSWVNARHWAPEFVQANLRLNRNMFDHTSLVLTYPYASAEVQTNKTAYPSFNVLQVKVAPDTAKITNTTRINATANFKRTQSFNFGTEFDNHQPSGGGNINKYYHLLSVSPFDNTLVYAAQEVGTSEAEATTAKLYVATTMNQAQKYFPLEVNLDNSKAQGSLVHNVASLYQEGFSFDLRSLKLDEQNQPKSLNLYFNPDPSAQQLLSNGMQSIPIGLLDDVLAQTNASTGWFTTPISPVRQGGQFSSTMLRSTSFLGLVHSRANLQHWYARTWQNINHPGNLYQANEQINQGANVETRAVVEHFNQPISYDDQTGVDLVTTWNSPNHLNAARRLVRRPVIKVRPESIANVLPLQTTHPLADSSFLSKPEWAPLDKDYGQKNAVFTKNDNLANASYQILTSWSKHVRFDLSKLAAANLSTVNPAFVVKWNLTRKPTMIWQSATLIKTH